MLVRRAGLTRLRSAVAPAPREAAAGDGVNQPGTAARTAASRPRTSFIGDHCSRERAQWQICGGAGSLRAGGRLFHNGKAGGIITATCELCHSQEVVGGGHCDVIHITTVTEGGHRRQGGTSKCYRGQRTCHAITSTSAEGAAEPKRSTLASVCHRGLCRAITVRIGHYRKLFYL